MLTNGDINRFWFLLSLLPNSGYVSLFYLYNYTSIAAYHISYPQVNIVSPAVLFQELHALRKANPSLRSISTASASVASTMTVLPVRVAAYGESNAALNHSRVEDPLRQWAAGCDFGRVSREWCWLTWLYLYEFVGANLKFTLAPGAVNIDPG